MAALVLPSLGPSPATLRLLSLRATLARTLALHPFARLQPRPRLLDALDPPRTLLDRLQTAATTLLGPASLTPDLNPFGILWAVPKKKVSHSRKRMRSAHKGIQPDLGLTSCPSCGEPKRKHYLCLNCYADKVLEKTKSFKTPWEKGITP